MGDALQTAKALDLIGRKEPPTAMCPVCPDEPLVMTFKWRGYEFFCVKCRGKFEFLDPRAEKSTPELDARVKAAEAAFDAEFVKETP